MKKLLSFFIIFYGFTATAQITSETLAEEIVTAAENSKSGNYNDILASVFQFAAKNIVGEDKTIEFNSTLFALKLKANPDLNKDVFFVNETFSRNLEMNFKANFDDDYSYTGFTGGVTYAFINGRDSKMAIVGEKLAGVFDKLTDIATAEAKTILISIVSDPNLSETDKAQKLQSLNIAQNAMLNNLPPPADTDAAHYYNQLASAAFNNESGLINPDGTLVGTLQAASQYVNLELDKFYEDLKAAPLLTLAVDGTSNKDGKFNRASASLVYLQGVRNSDMEFDIRTRFLYADTLAISMPRHSAEAEAGINFIIGKRSGATDGVRPATLKSFFEIKSYFEYSTILKNRLPDEEKEMFSANADFRLRIAEGLWIPFTVKYDLDNANVFGFLNVTFNFE